MTHPTDPTDPSGVSPPTDGVGLDARERRAVRFWLRVVRVSRALEGRIAARLLAEFGAHFIRFDVMSQLYRAPGGALSARALGARLLTPSRNISRLLARMEADGLLLRLPSGRDRRSLAIGLTPSGRERFEAMAQAHGGWVRDALSGLDESFLVEVERTLQGLERELARPPRGSPGKS